MGPIYIPGYEIERELGVGGMARVYLAIQTSLERRVALKVMAPALAADPTFSKRFLREARTIAGLTHPNIVSVYEVGVSPDHLHYFSMQFLPGGDFASRMRKGVSSAEIVRVLSGIAKALGFAHGQGVVHRDVTPGNIMFDAADTPLLTDFGIARALSGSTRITSTGVSIGTSHYMSPEQARGGEVDARSDLYSLGALCFEALTGRPPYQGADGFAVAYAHVFEPIPRLPPQLGAWQAFIDRALAKDPKDRYASAEEFVQALTGISADSLREVEPEPTTTTAAALTPVKSTTTVMESLARQIGPKPARLAGGVPWMRAAMLLAVVAGLSAVGYGVYLQMRDPDPAAAVASKPPSSKPVPAPTSAQPPPQEAATTLNDAGQPIEPVVPVDAAGEATAVVTAPPQDWGPLPPASIVQNLLALGEAAVRGQRFQLPPDANAMLFYQRVLQLVPDNAAAVAGIGDVVNGYLKMADEDFAAGRFDEVFARVERARQSAQALPQAQSKPLIEKADAQLRGYADGYRAEAQSAAARWDNAAIKAAAERGLRYAPGDKELTRLLAEAERIGKPGYRFQDALGNGSKGPALVIAGTGKLQLSGAKRGGSPTVNVSQSFAVAVYETTRAEFQQFLQASGHQVKRDGCSNRDGGFFSTSRDRTWRDPDIAQDAKHPVVCVSHADALAYAQWLSKETGQSYRLLSEAEWQFLAGAAKGGTACKRGNRADLSYKSEFGGTRTQNCQDGAIGTAPVGGFEATPPGLYDIDGNVREWVADCSNESHDGRSSDQKARTTGNCNERMVMGTSWASDQDESEVIQRRSAAADWRSNTTGFRVARVLAPPK